jgi:hypothetical protein
VPQTHTNAQAHVASEKAISVPTWIIFRSENAMGARANGGGELLQQLAVVTLHTKMFNLKTFYVLPTQCVCVLCGCQR